MTNKRWWILLGILVCCSLTIGANSAFTWQGIVQGDEKSWLILTESRIPRTISVLLAGSSMSMAGLLMQTITQNHFAAPSTVGTTQAAQFGMLASLFFFPEATLAQKMFFAFLSAVLFTLLFLKGIRHFSFKEKWMLPLVGIVYSGMIGALAEMIAYRFQLVQSLSSWLQGSFSMIQTHQYEWLFLVMIVGVVIWYFSHAFTIMSLGEETSTILGIPYPKLEWLALLLIALTTSVTMITVGSLPFLGVVVPNLVRRYYGDHLKETLGLVALFGMIFVLVCDILARIVIAPYEISVSLLLGIMGSVLFIRLLWRVSKHA